MAYRLKFMVDSVHIKDICMTKARFYVNKQQNRNH